MNQGKKYRTKIHTFGDILEVIMEGGREGVIITSVSRKANLSHYPTIEKCKKLISAELIELKIRKPNNVFTITDKGFYFIQEYKKFQKLMNSLNLRH